MRGKGSDGLVVAMKLGNSSGAKGADSLAKDARQLARGGACD